MASGTSFFQKAAGSGVSDKDIKYSNLEFHEELGEGGFGTVNRVTFKNAYKGYVEAAAKTVRGMRKEEVEIMSKLKHTNIVTWIGFYRDGPVNIIFIEYAKGGSLHDYLSDTSRPLPYALKRKWAKESALAIRYLHENKCLHRDIKPKNCLLFENNTLKLCDFGLAREIDDSFTLSSAKGTYQFMAPEIINTNADNKATFSIYTDIYAYGMLLLAIYTRQNPFHGKEYGYVVFHVGNGTLQPDIPQEVPEDIRNVIKQCWEVEPRKRPTMKRILEGTLHQWTQKREIQLGQPVMARRIALHPNGNMVVSYMKQVHLLDGDGKYKMSLTSPETAGPWSDYIIAVCISPQGNVYIIQRHSHIVRVFSESGTYLHSFSILTEGADPSTAVYPLCAVIDRDGNLLVSDSERGVITIHACPGGEITSHIKLKVQDTTYVMKGIVNSKKQILWYCTPIGSVYSKVVAIDYSGNELYSFTPKIEEDPDEACVYPGGMVCDSYDNVFIALHVWDRANTGHIHKYSSTDGAFLECTDKRLYRPCDLSMTLDGSSIAVANLTSILIYSLE
ncbi:uncharacterized protein [Amphiura filiformis]|uniref:uncharacterized protein n=1 Tax=Amphiura filiformis TaxID=82378 RepID=UPI003B21006D